MAGRVEGKVAFVTGAARGQGRSHAARLAEEGADIIAVDICRPITDNDLIPTATPDDLAQTADLVKGLNRRIVTAEVDVRDFDALKAAVDSGVEQLGRSTSSSPMPASATVARRWTRPAKKTGTP
jgi:NAD(P)-dependent dehydrogenase (short-subunit alcohol dehydrogenase family)